MVAPKEPFLGPRWAKQLLGWSLLVPGGILALALGTFVVTAVVVGEWSVVAPLVLWTVIGGGGAFAGWSMLRMPAKPVPQPRGSFLVSLAGVAMVGVLFLWSWVLIDRDPGPASGAVTVVHAVFVVLLLAGFRLIRVLERLRGRRLGPWQWGALFGGVGSLCDALVLALNGRAWWVAVGAGCVTGLLVGFPIAGGFLWWQRVGRPWALQNGARLRWPMD